MGLVLSNGVIALAGALIAQQEGYADVSRGIGVIVVGLASLIIGEVIFKSLTLADAWLLLLLVLLATNSWYGESLLSALTQATFDYIVLLS